MDPAPFAIRSDNDLLQASKRLQVRVLAAVLVPLTLALTFSREIIYQRLMAVLPYMKKINAAILILAGAYMIYYGLA